MQGGTVLARTKYTAIKWQFRKIVVVYFFFLRPASCNINTNNCRESEDQ
jgi:hypothetical protein